MFVVAPNFLIKGITWKFNQPSQVNIGAYTGIRQAVTNPWFGRWSASVTLAQQQSDATFATMRAFVASCVGSLGVFRLYATVEPQNSNFGVKLAAALAQGATTANLVGGVVGTGCYITINGQLLLVINGGSGISFQPPLRQAAASETPVITSRPYALVYLVNPEQAWDISPYRLFNMSFDVAEAVREPDGATVPETELITNGTFTTDTSAWTGNGATLSDVSGRMRVTNTGATQGYGSQTITVIPGKSYLVKWDAVPGTAASPALILVDGGTPTFTSTAVGAGQSTVFTPATNNLTVRCYAYDTTSGHYYDYDNISVREA